MILHEPGDGAGEGVPIVLQRLVRNACAAHSKSCFMGGITLPMIGKLLGHTQVETTARSAHLFDDPLRAGLEQVGGLLATAPAVVAADTAA